MGGMMKNSIEIKGVWWLPENPDKKKYPEHYFFRKKMGQTLMF
jgi:hypothetical protein